MKKILLLCLAMIICLGLAFTLVINAEQIDKSQNNKSYVENV